MATAHEPSSGSVVTARPAHASAPKVTRLSVLIPAYNSETTLGKLIDHTLEVLRPRYGWVQVVVVNDGSRDDTHRVALAAVERHQGAVRYVRLARNAGEHNAVMCGLNHVSGDCVAIIDDDFQNPPEEICTLVDRLEDGFDVVYSYYESKRHSWFRNLGSSFNDWVATRVLGKPRGLYLSSFKVLNSFLVRQVVAYEGPFPYLDGLILRSTQRIGRQLCRHEDRQDGRSNYTLTRLVALWLNMTTSFSVAPLRIASFTGLAMSFAGLAMALFFVLSWRLGGILSEQQIPPGWASIMVTLTVFSGIQLSLLGMVGEYLGRVFLTLNKAPQFVVRDRFGFDATDRLEREDPVHE